MIKKTLAELPQINTDSDKPPRVYFSDFNDLSLKIYMSYWVRPPDVRSNRRYRQDAPA